MILLIAVVARSVMTYWRKGRLPWLHLAASRASPIFTSVRDDPNSRAILAGVTPALKAAARTAFSFPSSRKKHRR
jgi:hypothetical protein